MPLEESAREEPAEGPCCSWGALTAFLVGSGAAWRQLLHASVRCRAGSTSERGFSDRIVLA